MNRKFIYNATDIRSCFLPLLEMIPESIFNISVHSDLMSDAYIGDLSIYIIKDNKFIFGTYPLARKIIFSTKVLDLVWITNYAMGVIYHEICNNQDVNKPTVEININTPKLAVAVKMLDAVYQSMADTIELNWDCSWPIPVIASLDKDIVLANNLMLGALAFIFHHEIAHMNQNNTLQGIVREVDADFRAACWILLDENNCLSSQCQTQGLAIVSALIVLNICGIRLQWWDGITHPFVYDRLWFILNYFFKNFPNSQVWSFPSVVITTTLSLTKNTKYIFHPEDTNIDHKDFFVNQVEMLRKMSNDLKPPYIYLDSMVFRYLSSPRPGKEGNNDRELQHVLSNIYNSYFIPFSEAHCLDLTKNYGKEKISDEMTHKDLNFIDQVSSFNMITVADDASYLISHYSAVILFSKILNEKQKENDLTFSFPLSLWDSRKIDLSRVSEDHFLFDLLKRTDGRITPEMLIRYLFDIFDSFFCDPQRYEKFRKSFLLSKEWIDQDSAKSAAMKRVLPIFDILSCKSETELKMKLPGIIDAQLLFSGKIWNNLSLYEKIELLYMLLDFSPCFSEKINRKNLLHNILRDCKHFIYACNAVFFVTEDASARKKALFVANYLQLHVNIVSIKDFVSLFSKDAFFTFDD